MINDRVEELIKSLCGGNKSAFAQRIGVTPSVVENIVGTRRGKPSYDVLEKIACAFANISFEWLLTGNGKMLRMSCSNNELSKDNTGSVVIRLPIDEKKLVPLYELSAMKVVNGSFVGDHQIPIDYIYIPNVSACDGAMFVKTNAMAPYLSAGDLVLFKQVKINKLPVGVYFGEIYMVAFSLGGNDYLGMQVVKQSDTEGQLRLASYNDTVKPQDIPINSIRAMALVKAGVKYVSMV